MSYWKGKKIFVTGGAGFIGSHLVRRLVEEQAKVHLIVRDENKTKLIEDILSKIVLHKGDLHDAARLNEIVTRVEPDGVFNLAGANQYFGHIPTIEENIRTNISATVNLMEIIRDRPVAFFVNTGTFAEVGSKTHAIREDDLLEPKEFYGISRVPATLYSAVLGKEMGLPYVTVRVFTPYGPYVQKGKLLYEVITKALCNEDISLTSPSVTRDFIYIDDLVDLYMTVAKVAVSQGGEIWNGGSGVATSLEDVASNVLKWTDSHSKVIWKGGRVSYDEARWEADMSKVKERLGWTPKTSFSEGLKQTIDWFKTHDDYWKKK